MQSCDSPDVGMGDGGVRTAEKARRQEQDCTLTNGPGSTLTFLLAVMALRLREFILLIVFRKLTLTCFKKRARISTIYFQMVLRRKQVEIYRPKNGEKVTH